MPHINLDTIFNWRNSDQILQKFQDFGVIRKDTEIKCSVNCCDGFFKLTKRSQALDEVAWSCSGIIRRRGYKRVKCTKSVEIVESKFGKRKFNGDHSVQGAWVFGGIERGSGRVFMEVVENRTEEALLQSIEKFIEPGTTIYSDCWKEYAGLEEHPHYSHLQVNHFLHFKDAEAGVHTNSIESLWRHANASAPYANRKKAFIGGYLARYMFLKMTKELNQDPLVLFFMLTRDLYNPTAEIHYQIEEEEGGDEELSEFAFD